MAQGRPETIYMIEVALAGNRWVPINQPCYSLPEALAKLSGQPKHGAPTRIGRYVREDIEIQTR
jgi:hypothetical protein